MRRSSNKPIPANNSIAAHPGGGPSSQGGAQQGTGARGEQYLDGSARSHKIAALELFARTVFNNKHSTNQSNCLSVFPGQVNPRLHHFALLCTTLQYSQKRTRTSPAPQSILSCAFFRTFLQKAPCKASCVL